MSGIPRRRSSPAAAPAARPAPAPIERAAFALFAVWLVLGFTTATHDQFALPKLIGLSAAATLSAAAWIAALARGRVVGLPAALTALSSATAVWWGTTTATALHVPTAVFGMPGRHGGLATMLACLVLFLFLATTRAPDRMLEERLAILALAVTAASVHAIVQALGLDPIPWPTERPASTLGHPVVFGGVLAMTIPFSAAFALGAGTKRSRTLWGLAALVQGLALALTLARGPWLAAAAALALFAALGLFGSRREAARTARRAALAATILVLAVAAWAPVRSAVLERLATLGRPADDSSLAYRAHFARAALAMVRDHPVLGIGWENYGLAYHAYRSPPTARIAPDLVPTMVHSGPLQAAVSGGIPAVALHVAFLAAVLAAVWRRFRAEDDPRPRRLGAAFCASGAAFAVQNLSGWPHVELDALAFAGAGIAMAWSGGREPRVVVARRWPLVFGAAAFAAAGAWWTADNVRLFRTERLLAAAEKLAEAGDWSSAFAKTRRALEVAPRAAASDAASRLYLARLAEAGDGDAYERGVRLVDEAGSRNPLDPYLRLRRAELDLLAMDAGLLATLTEDGRDALADATSATVGSARVSRVAESVERKANGSSVRWIGPASVAGFGPPGGLVVAGQSPRALRGTRARLHWREATRGSPWRAEAAVPIDAAGNWYAAIPGAEPRRRYVVYATSETWASGPCRYTAAGSIGLCVPLALIEPDTTGVGPKGSLLVAGAAPTDGAALSLASQGAFSRAASPGGAATATGVALPLDAPGTWYAFLPASTPGEPRRVTLRAGSDEVASCTEPRDGLRTFCAPLAIVEPQSAAGFGPPGTLIVGGSLPRGVRGTPVFLHWRNATRRSAWSTEVAAPSPDARGVWYNAIPEDRPGEQYEILVTSPTTATPTCLYAGDGGRTNCS